MRMPVVLKLMLAVLLFFGAIGANAGESEHKTVSFSLTTDKRG